MELKGVPSWLNHNILNFNEFGFNESLMEGLYSMGYKAPTPIQMAAIPTVSAGKDLIACAQTGTGKTAAYLLPVINEIIAKDIRHLNALIIAPTRELVLQIDQQIDGMGYFCGVSSIAIYGGNDGITWSNQKHALEQGVDIVCATPGRLIALLQNGDINFNHLKFLILDEADRMLDMGFFDDIMTIIKYLPVERQTIMFSATMPPRIRQLAAQITKNPEQINIAISKPAAGITQQVYHVNDNQKEELLRTILQDESYQSVIIFASTREKVKQLEKTIKPKNRSIKAFHSDLEQVEREQIMRAFKSRQLDVLIGTDILSRGIDVDGISLVVNFDVPPDPEDYIHRIGRTARAERNGVAITFVNGRDFKRMHEIESLMGMDVSKVDLPESLGPAPVLTLESPHRRNNSHDKEKKTFQGGKRKFHGGNRRQNKPSPPKA